MTIAGEEGFNEYEIVKCWLLYRSSPSESTAFEDLFLDLLPKREQ